MLLNIACGKRYHKDWVNIDFDSDSSFVNEVNILNGLPYSDESFDYIYCGHFIEHLTPANAEFVVREMLRVLRKSGVARIVVPDLRNICQEYLTVLQALEFEASESNEQKYRWITLELLDQMVRSRTSGEMGLFFEQIKQNQNKTLADYIFTRTGDRLLGQDFSHEPINPNMMARIKKHILKSYLNLVSKLVPRNIRESIFIKTTVGERHLWMYDSYSLSEMMIRMGFSNVKKETFNSSSIPSFNNYFLDINRDQTPYKGLSSLYVEATK